MLLAASKRVRPDGIGPPPLFVNSIDGGGFTTMACEKGCPPTDVDRMVSVSSPTKGVENSKLMTAIPGSIVAVCGATMAGLVLAIFITRRRVARDGNRMVTLPRVPPRT